MNESQTRPDALELQLIGLALSQWPSVQAHFAPELFADEALQEIAAAIVAVAGKMPGKPPGAAKVHAALPAERARLLSELRAAVDPLMVDAAEIAEALRRKRQGERLETLLVATGQAARERDADLPALIASLQRSLLDVLYQARETEVHAWTDVLLEIRREIDGARDGKAVPVLPIGLSRLSSRIGGLRRKEMTVLAARPGMGKSALSGHIAVHLARRRKIRSLVVSLEMPRGGWVGRTVARDARIDSRTWQDPARWSVDMLRAVDDGMAALSGLPVDIIDRRGLDVDQICALARMQKAQHADMELIVVDHLGLVEAGSLARRGENTATTVGRISKRLRDLTDELDVALVLLCQLNRSVEGRDRADRAPKLSDLRDSGRIEEDADVVLGLYRRGYYSRQDEADARLAGVCEVHVLKGRNVGTGAPALLKFDGPYFDWRDLTDDEARAYLQAVNE